MADDARKALATIRRCVASDRVRVLPHFARRLDQRGMVWADVLAVIDAPDAVRADGHDGWGRPRWILTGEAGDGLPIRLVCVIGRDAAGELTVFVTIFWED